MEALSQVKAKNHLLLISFKFLPEITGLKLACAGFNDEIVTVGGGKYNGARF